MAVAVLNHNEPAFTCVSAKAFEKLMDLVDDLELGRPQMPDWRTARSRCGSACMPLDPALHPEPHPGNARRMRCRRQRPEETCRTTCSMTE
jgi:hypothetical protein